MITKLHIEPTLFIYLGTSAGKVGWRLKQLLSEVYGDIPILRHLWIDTDHNVDPDAAPWFSPMERAVLAGFNADAVLANINAYPTIKSWWPRNSRLRPGFMKDGAGQIRLQGRLAFHRMFAERSSGPAVIDKLRAAADALQQIENYDKVEAMSNEHVRYIVERESVRVVMVETICGGTGSAIAWDVAYLARHLLAGSNPTIVNIAVLPPVVDKALKNEIQVQREKIRANAYAWIKEHEYLMEHPRWRVAYPEGAPLDVQSPPFNLRFLVDIVNQAGDRLNTDDDVYTMIALALFLDTGSAIAGAIRGFNANVGVLLEEFQGRRRVYSSLAAGSLIYPVEKIGDYCGIRLGQAMAQQGLLAKPNGDEVVQSTSALLGEQQLRDPQLLENLLAERRILNTNTPAIRKSESVEKIRSLLAMQEQQNDRERRHQEEGIAESGTKILARVQKELERKIAVQAVTHGIPYAQAMLAQMLTLPAEEGLIHESTLSLLGFKRRLQQQGVTETDLTQAETQYREAREKLRSLEGGFLKGVNKKLRGKTWRQNLDRVRNDALQWLEEANQISLQLAAQRTAANIYDQLIAQAQTLKDDLGQVSRTVARTVEELTQAGEERLKPATARQGMFELALEAVDESYIRAYYEKHAGTISAADAHHSFAAKLTVTHVDALKQWQEDTLARALQQHAAGYFRQDLQETSLLQALAEHHGERAAAVIEAQLDRLVKYCHPFWLYDRDKGLTGHEGKSIMGVEDEHSELIPPKYRDNIQYELKSTGFKHRIDVARVQHGLPAFLLRGMEDYKAYYDMKRKGIDPLHVILDTTDFREVIPDERQEARDVFAIAATFGYIVQIGSWYYFDPRREYEASKMHPGRDKRLAQGREKAEDEFSQHDDFVLLSDQLIEREIENMGNQAAIALLDEHIQAHKQAISQMALENELRKQYEKEMRAMQAKQRRLGLIGIELPTMAA